MMAWLWLHNGLHKLYPSASGLPMPIADCCRWTPNRPNSQIQITGLVAYCVRIEINLLDSVVRQSQISTIATVGLGIKSP